MNKNCKQCGQDFTVFAEDLKFYEKIAPTFDNKKFPIPAPNFCPDCRQQRRLTFRNERTLYHRTCDLTGKKIISLYSQDKKNKVYNTSDWWKDSWDAKDYGRDFDHGRPFFEQFHELMLDVPEISLMNDDERSSENCAYTNDFAYSKNCYLCFVTWYNEDCAYSTGIHYSKDTFDSLDTMKSELCYETIDCDNCYRGVYLQYSEGCNDCYFGYDLRGCKNCFKCAGLKNKQYYIENKPYSKEEYNRILKEAKFSSYENFEKAKKEYFKFLLKVPHRNVFTVNCENCRGNKLKDCKNVWGFESYGCEDSRYIYHCPPLKDCYDLTNTGKSELCYDTVVSNDAYHSLFTNECWNSNEAFYCNHCFNCDNIFGCSGLKKQKYCILNKQYSRDEYGKLVAEIVKNMVKNGEWGEFFPINVSPFAYNETSAQEYYPLEKDEVLAKGWGWKDEEEEKRGRKSSFVVADDINDVLKDICDRVLVCEKTGKFYKIIPQELAFYKKLGLPIPRICPEQRHIDRMAIRYPRKIWQRKCGKCGAGIWAGYSPDRAEIVYCEKCYLREVE